MFWWGNYIPETQVNQGVSASAVFVLNELVANVDNARKRYTLTGTINQQLVQHNNVIVNQDGTWDIFNSSGVWQTNETPRTLGALRWEENKSAESAVKATKTVNWNAIIGYPYFISPKEYGQATVMSAGFNLEVAQTRYEVVIDGIEYFITVTGVQTAPVTAIYQYSFN
jgi:hypothetical protein